MAKENDEEMGELIDHNQYADVKEIFEKNPKATIIRIWLPDTSKAKDLGHISLQTSKYYVSFWPEGNIKNRHGKISAKIIYSFKDELNTIHRWPDEFIVLHQLNTSKINEQIESIEGKHFNWRMFGKLTGDEVTKNCSQLVHELLKIGEIENLVPPLKYQEENVFALCKRALGGLSGMTIAGLPAAYLNTDKLPLKIFIIFYLSLYACVWVMLLLYITCTCLAPLCRTMAGRGAIASPEGIFQLVRLARQSENINERNDLNQSEKISLLKSNSDKKFMYSSGQETKIDFNNDEENINSNVILTEEISNESSNSIGYSVNYVQKSFDKLSDQSKLSSLATAKFFKDSGDNKKDKEKEKDDEFLTESDAIFAVSINCNSTG